MARSTAPNKDVFINCSFDSKFLNLFYAKIFCIYDCGFRARCALESEDSGEKRIDKIFAIIEQCQYGIHDISYTELCKNTKLPRFNMPLELGFFLGAKRYGNKGQKQKRCLITDRDLYRYKIFISDISGYDIKSHDGSSEKIIKAVRDWLKNNSKETDIPGPAEIVKRYDLFKETLPNLCKLKRITPNELTFIEYCQLVSIWLNQNRLS